MPSTQPKEYTIVIAGGGAGGVSVAAALKLAQPDLNIALVFATWKPPKWRFRRH